MSILDKMTPDEIWVWEWKALPRWAKAFTFLVGVPSFAILSWSTFDEAVSGTVQLVCFVIFTTVSLVQIFCLNRLLRKGDR